MSARRNPLTQRPQPWSWHRPQSSAPGHSASRGSSRDPSRPLVIVEDVRSGFRYFEDRLRRRLCFSFRVADEEAARRLAAAGYCRERRSGQAECWTKPPGFENRLEADRLARQLLALLRSRASSGKA